MQELSDLGYAMILIVVDIFIFATAISIYKPLWHGEIIKVSHTFGSLLGGAFMTILCIASSIFTFFVIKFSFFS